MSDNLKTTRTETGPAVPPASAPTLPDDLAEPAPLNVLIVYEDPAASRRALGLISRLATHTAGQVEFRPSFWRFDMLEDQEWREVATWDALAADMIILSTRDAAEPPSAINAWLEECMARRGEKKTALLALFGSSGAWAVSLQDDIGFSGTRLRAAPAAVREARVGNESRYAA